MGVCVQELEQTKAEQQQELEALREQVKTRDTALAAKDKAMAVLEQDLQEAEKQVPTRACHPRTLEAPIKALQQRLQPSLLVLACACACMLRPGKACARGCCNGMQAAW